MEAIWKVINLEIAKLIEVCLRYTFLNFLGKFCEQNNGVSMGTPLFPIVANIYMESFETMAINYYPLNPKVWKM